MKNIIDEAILLIGGFIIGFFASKYNWWILLIGIPYLYFTIKYNFLKDDLKV